MRWPQAKVSRVERGRREVTLTELLELGRAFGCSASDLLAELQAQSAEALGRTPVLEASLSPAFYAAYHDKEAMLAQLSRYGVHFLGEAARPALVALPVDETVLAALRFLEEPRVFEALPALLLKHAERVDWTKLASAAYALGLQNRLGMTLAAALKLKASAKNVGDKTWADIYSLHNRLAERKLDREEVVGTRPKTEAALSLLRERTPEWLRFWHGLGSGDLESFKRYLAR